MESHLISDKKNNICTLTLNNPAKMNAMGWEMLYSLQKAFETLKADDSVKVLIIRGAGGKAFSAGGDLKEFDALDRETTGQWIKLGHEIFNQLENLPMPTIALIDGYALGGGLELALACDFRVATPSAVFSNPELQHGWIPGWGGLTRLPRIISEAKAKEMILLGAKIDAWQAYDIGLVHRLVEKEEVEGQLKEMTDALQQLDPMAFQSAKFAIQRGRSSTNHEAVMYDVLATYYSKLKKGF